MYVYICIYIYIHITTYCKHCKPIIYIYIAVFLYMYNRGIYCVSALSLIVPFRKKWDVEAVAFQETLAFPNRSPWRCRGTPWGFFIVISNQRTSCSWQHRSTTPVWLVVWNIFKFSIYWECHHPNWRSHIFQRGRSTTNQMYSWFVDVEWDGDASHFVFVMTHNMCEENASDRIGDIPLKLYA